MSMDNRWMIELPEQDVGDGEMPKEMKEDIQQILNSKNGNVDEIPP